MKDMCTRRLLPRETLSLKRASRCTCLNRLGQDEIKQRERGGGGRERDVDKMVLYP